MSATMPKQHLGFHFKVAQVLAHVQTIPDIGPCSSTSLWIAFRKARAVQRFRFQLPAFRRIDVQTP
jgi:hypothetical protein